MHAYAAATDDVAGGPVFAIVPVWETIAPASRSVASRRGAQARRPLRAGHRPPPSDRGRRRRSTSRATPIALLPRPNGTSLVIRRRDARRGRRARQRAVRDGVLPRHRGRGEHRRAGSRPSARPRTAPIRWRSSRTGRRGPDRSLRGGVGRRLRDPSRRRVRARRSACPAGSSTASARWRSPDVPFSRRPAIDDPRRGAPARGPLLGAALSRRHA